MKSLRVSLVLTSMLVLSASTLSAQSSKIPCKDGTKAKGGHFSCWGHGGIVTGAVKPAQKTEAKATSKPAKQERAASNAKPVGLITRGRTESIYPRPGCTSPYSPE